MINIPTEPFKIIEASDEHPFIKNALRPRKHFESCWCGSGRKYKKCHRVRAEQDPIPISKLLHEQDKIFWKKRGCMHPMAARTTCRGVIVDAHSIQRKGPLSAVVDGRNHVCRFEHDSVGELRVSDVGWKKASTFPGFCAHHDSETFSGLERNQFDGAHEHCVLQAYRCVSNELYKKRALIESLKYQRDFVDRGFNLEAQLNFQLSCHMNLAGQSKSAEELEYWWRTLGESVLSRKFDCFASEVFFFEGSVSVVSAAALHAEFDFRGNKLVDMWDLRNDAEMLAHSVMTRDGGGAIVFVFGKDSRDAKRVVESFREIDRHAKGDIFIQYCFLNSENTFFSREWWSDLPSHSRAMLERLMPLTFYEGGAFQPTNPRVVDWKFTHEVSTS